MPLILGTNSIKDTGYNVANSLRFDRASGDYLSRTPSGAGNRKIFTFSTWLKGHNADAKGSGYFFQADISGSSNVDAIGVTASGFQVSVNSATSGALNTTQLFRDYSAWYHFVFAVDTTQSTASNRMKLYVNGSQITDFDTETYPSQDYQFTGFNTTQQHNVSWRDSEVDGYMCEVVFIDGQQLDPTSFGEFDEDSGIWKPKAVSGLTFGTNGFYLDFENSGSLGADVSGRGNNFTVNNLTAIDQSTDTCTNNFSTMNSLDNYYQGSTFSEGNLKIVTGSSSQAYNTSTMMVSSGKWYVECKVVSGSATANIGVVAKLVEATSGNNAQIAYNQYGWAYIDSGLVWNNGSSVGGTWSSYTAGDIIGIAINLDNEQGGLNKLYFSKNGTWQNGADPSNYTSTTGVVGITKPSGTPIGAYAFGMNETWNDNTKTFSWNFGSPEFSISSGNSDGNGYGNFEYAVPTGFYALNTKNLAEYG